MNDERGLLAPADLSADDELVVAGGSVIDKARHLLEPVLNGRDLEIYDLTYGGGVLRIYIDKPGGVLLDEVAGVTKVVSRLLDDHEVVSGRYTLEVTSPGLERPLRHLDHYMQAVGETVSVKLGPHVSGERRIQGVLESCDEVGITVSVDGIPLQVDYADISKARTVFEWVKKKAVERNSR